MNVHLGPGVCFLFTVIREVLCADTTPVRNGTTCSECRDFVEKECATNPGPQFDKKSSCFQGYCEMLVLMSETGRYSVVRGCPVGAPLSRTTTNPKQPNIMVCYFKNLPLQCDCTYDGCNGLSYKQFMKLKYAHDREAADVEVWRIEKSTVDEYLAEPDIPMPLGDQTIPFGTTHLPLTFDPLQKELNDNAGASERGGDAPAAAGKKNQNGTSNTAPESEESAGLSTTMIAVIVGVLLLVLIILGVVLYRINANKNKKKKRPEDEEDEEGEGDEEDA